MYGNKFKPNDAPDSHIVTLKLSMKQIRLLARITDAELHEVECEASDSCEKTLQSLFDVFWKHTQVLMSPEEIEEQNRRCNEATHAGNIAYQKAVEEYHAKEAARHAPIR